MKSRTTAANRSQRNIIRDEKDLIDDKIRAAENKFKISKENHEKLFKRGLADAFQGVETYIESDYLFKKFNLYNPDTSAKTRFEGLKAQEELHHNISHELESHPLPETNRPTYSDTPFSPNSPNAELKMKVI